MKDRVVCIHSLTAHGVVGLKSFLARLGEAALPSLTIVLAGLLPGGRPDPVRVAWLPQGARCAWGMTVAEVVALGRVLEKGADWCQVEIELIRQL